MSDTASEVVARQAHLELEAFRKLADAALAVRELDKEARERVLRMLGALMGAKEEEA